MRITFCSCDCVATGSIQRLTCAGSGHRAKLRRTLEPPKSFGGKCPWSVRRVKSNRTEVWRSRDSTAPLHVSVWAVGVGSSDVFGWLCFELRVGKLKATGPWNGHLSYVTSSRQQVSQ